MIPEPLAKALEDLTEYLRKQKEPISPSRAIKRLTRGPVRDIDLREAVWILIGRGTIVLTQDQKLEYVRPDQWNPEDNQVIQPDGSRKTLEDLNGRPGRESEDGPPEDSEEEDTVAVRFQWGDQDGCVQKSVPTAMIPRKGDGVLLEFGSLRLEGAVQQVLWHFSGDAGDAGRTQVQVTLENTRVPVQPPA